MTERRSANKPARSFAKPLREVAQKLVGETFRHQGFASAELVTRWSEIVGAEISVHSEPIKIQWPRPVAPGQGSAVTEGTMDWGQQPGTLVLRVEGPAAIEIQHLGNLICDRVNRFLGWRAVARIALRQAPLRGAEPKVIRRADSAAAARMAETLTDIADDDLRQALARLGAAVRRG